MDTETDFTAKTGNAEREGFQTASAGRARLYLRKSGTWSCWFYAPDGRRVQRSTGCRDREAANAVALRMEREAHAQRGEEMRWFAGPFTSYVYFIQSGEHGPIKIGRTGSVGVRLTRMQTGSPERLRLLCAIPGGGRLERALHKAHRDARIEGGEWFRPTDGLLALVSELARICPLLPAA